MGVRSYAFTLREGKNQSRKAIVPVCVCVCVCIKCLSLKMCVHFVEEENPNSIKVKPSTLYLFSMI